MCLSTAVQRSVKFNRSPHTSDVRKSLVDSFFRIFWERKTPCDFHLIATDIGRARHRGSSGPLCAGGVRDGAVGRATLSPHDFEAQRRCAVVFLRTARNVVNSPPAHPAFGFFKKKKIVSFAKASSRRAYGGRGNRTQLIHIRGQDR